MNAVVIQMISISQYWWIQWLDALKIRHFNAGYITMSRLEHIDWLAYQMYIGLCNLWFRSFQRLPGARFTNGFLPAIQTRWKLCIAITPLLAITSQQIFARAMYKIM